MEPEAALPQGGIPLSDLVVAQPAHYVAYNGRHLAALVIGHSAVNTVDLAVFTNMENVAGKKNFGLQFHQEVEYSREPRPGTWHWPETMEEA